MPTSFIVVANPAPDPARKWVAPFCGTHAALPTARRRRIGRSLVCTLVDRCGGNFVGGRMGTSFGH